MKVFRSIEEIRSAGGSAATVGAFDGLHTGHLFILDHLKQTARRENLISTVVTFDPHPKKIVSAPGSAPIRLLTSTAEKLEILEREQIDQVVLIPFTREFAALSYESFVRDVLVEKLSVREVIIGYNHHFGRNREGGLRELMELGRRFHYGVQQLPPFQLEGENVNSSLVRRLIAEGKVQEAAVFLGRQYQLTGTVVRGDGRGRTIGFPTANIAPNDPEKLLPGRGVYAVDALVAGSCFKGMMNIGTRPTFDIESLTLEVHLFNFTADLYGDEITVYFKKFIRPEKKFAGISELQTQLSKDKAVSEKL